MGLKKMRVKKNKEKIFIDISLTLLFLTLSYTINGAEITAEAISAPVNPPYTTNGEQYTNDGAEIFVRTIRFTGNTQFTSAALSDVLTDSIRDAPVINSPYHINGAQITEEAIRDPVKPPYITNDADVGKYYTFAGLKKLANLITNHYRIHDFVHSRAIIPVQTITDGVLVIEIIEGRYSRIRISGDEKYAAQAKVFLNTLQTGEIIHKASLDRTVLILEDQPGFKTASTLSPGQEVGTTDLNVNVERDKRYSGNLAFDNHGNLYTGQKRSLLNLNFNSPFLFGDQLKLNMLYTEESLWLAAFNYSLPLGGSGLRANVGYTHAGYELGENFASSEIHGTAKISLAGLSYPIIRSQHVNLSVSGTYLNKVMNNREDITPSSNTNSSDSLPISISFDRRDDLAGGGISYGSISWTHGDFTVATANRATDSATAKTAGSFDKFNLDLFRLQALPANFTLFGHVSAQWAGNNLDSSEKFGIGGLSGVRAYPIGEAFGDEGVLLQLEVRHTIDNFTPYVFFDIGTLQSNHNPWVSGGNQRTLGGPGLGLRADFDHFSFDTSVAWATIGVFSDVNQADNPKFWINAVYKF